MTDCFLSIVVPVRDACSYLESSLREIETVVQPLVRHYEIVLIDDVSSDGTVERIHELQRRMTGLQLYCLNRRSGLDVALVAGLDNAIGDYVITMNIQTDPATLIPALWQKARAGSHVVCGVRTDLPEAGLQAWARRSFYRLFRAAAGIDVPSGVSDLRLYSRQAVGYITRNNDRHLLLRVLPFFTSHRVAVLRYAAERRGAGFGRRGPSHAILSGLTILISSSSLPLRFLTLLSVLSGSLSLFYALYVVAVAALKQHVVEGWVSLALPMAVMFFFLSVILGLLSEYIYLLAQQSGNRPTYLIADESTSSVLPVRNELNIVDAAGSFAPILANEPATADLAALDQALRQPLERPRPEPLTLRA
ncbi:MAG TPA: glycosyltransferase [Bryobacteraceae bacterium]|nr:glycosyltransferase [Bryobacteraceae bacterium]